MTSGSDSVFWDLSTGFFGEKDRLWPLEVGTFCPVTRIAELLGSGHEER